MKNLVIVMTLCVAALTYVSADSLRMLNPEVRSESRMITDTLHNRIILFGGNNRGLWGKCFNDVWSFDLVTGAWKIIDLAEPLPAPRHDASVVYDALGNRMILFGGWNGITGSFYNDVWSLDLTPGSEEWTQLTPSGTPPNVRAATNAVIDPVNNRMIVFGGSDGSSGYNDTWSLEFNRLTWYELSTPGICPSKRFAHATIYDEIGHQMIIFGGDNYYQPMMNDVWSLDLTYGKERWREFTPDGSRPDTRAQHFYALNDVSRDMIIGFGYNLSSGCHSDIWALNLNSLTWRQVLPSDVVEARRGSCAAYDPLNQQIIIFGGDWYDYYWGDTYALILDAVGVEEKQNSHDLVMPYIKISSNPSRLPMRIEIFTPSPGETHLNITDVSGRLVNTLIEAHNVGKQTIQWDGKDSHGREVPAGTYFIKLVVNGQSVVKKAVVVE